jgi:hypothetical protein
LAPDHLIDAASNAPRTVLASLGAVCNVDRLASDQPPIRFAVSGITLIYGPNGSGKSGYCRIAKQLCRSVHRDELRGSVYDKAASARPEVAVSFRVGDDGEPKVEQVWREDDPPPPELARISVLDAASARIYVDKERKIEFLPYELDLLNKLGVACRALDQVYKQRAEGLNTAIQTPLPTGYTDGTEVQQLVAKLAPSTPLDHLPSETQLRELATWADADQAELDSLIQRLHEDPDTKVRLRQETQQVLETIKGEGESVKQNLGDPAMEALRRKQKDAAIKDEVAQASARDLFQHEPVPDVGSNACRQMLLYAREFAAEVFCEREPPQLATGGRCVLCQQDLGPNASRRMVAFDRYIADRAAEEAAHARSEFQGAVAHTQALSVKGKGDIKVTLVGYAALDQTRRQRAETLETFFEKASQRLAHVKRILREQAYQDLDALDPLPAFPLQLVTDEIAALGQEISEIDGLHRDENTKRQLERQPAELTDRRKLRSEIETIVERRNQLEERHRVLACRAQ